MRNFILVVFILCSCSVVSAQKTFKEMFNIYNHWESFVNVLKVNNFNYTLLGVSRNLLVNDSSKYGQVFIVNINENNRIEKINTISKKYNTITKPIPLKYNLNKFVYGLLDTNNNGSVPYKIIDYDSNLSFSNEKDLHFFNKTNLTNDNVYYINNKLYFFCADYTTFISSKVKLSMQCMDTNGNLLWGKIFQDKRCYTNNVVQTKDGNFLIAGIKYFGESTGSGDSAFAWFAKIDTIGNILWEHLLDRKSSLLTVVAWLTKANDKCFLTGCNIANYGYYDDVFGDTSFCYIAEIDENNGNILWKKRFLTVVNNLSGLDSRVGALTYHKGSLYGLINHNLTNTSNQFVMFAKFDLQGNILWKRLFQQANYSNRAYSLTPIEDGFLICGDAKDSTKAKGDSDAWLIKTDSNGCIIPGCNAEVGIVQIINPEKVFTVYPNPAQNEINVGTENLNVKIESLAIYNMQGQLFKTVTKTTKINTEDLANGNYLLIITTDKQQMAGKKFVVER